MVVEYAVTVAEFVADPTSLGGVKMARGALQLFQGLRPDGKFIEARDEMFRGWVAELAGSLTELEGRLSESERAEYHRRTVDDEFMAVTANYFREAHKEPLEERRRMLAYAAAAIANLSLGVGELSRIQRVLRELDPYELSQLFRISRIPGSPSRKHHERYGMTAGTQGTLQYNYWQRETTVQQFPAGERPVVVNAEALESSGCVVIRANAGGVSATTSPELLITTTGRTLLRALRPYLLLSVQDLSDVPGHEESDDFCTREEAEKMFAALPGLKDTLHRVQRARHRLQYDWANVAGGAVHDAKAKLVLHMTEAEAASLGPAATDRRLLNAKELDCVFVGQLGQPKGGEVELHVCGPHDAMRWLAYEFDARWS